MNLILNGMMLWILGILLKSINYYIKKLPTTTNLKICWVISFLDKKDDMNWWMRNVMLKSDWGSYYLTAKRMVYRYADYIIDEINNS